ncbi:MAG: CAP domain-containing protein [Dermatophilaceae bacterium]
MSSARTRSSGHHAAPRHTPAAGLLFQRHFLLGVLALGVIALLLVITTPGFGSSGSSGGSQLAAAMDADPENPTETDTDTSTSTSEDGNSTSTATGTATGADADVETNTTADSNSTTATATGTASGGSPSMMGSYCISVNLKGVMVDGAVGDALKSLRRICAEMDPNPTASPAAPAAPSETEGETAPETDPAEKTETETVEEPAAPAPAPAQATRKMAAKPMPTPESKPAAQASGPAAEVIALVNAERAKAGCESVTAEARLTKAAQGHSVDMAENTYMEHQSRDGRSPFDRMKDAGYQGGSMAENIAYGQDSPQDVMQDWMNSDGHRKNILNCDYTQIGVGVANASNGDIYWTQNFGRP